MKKHLLLLAILNSVYVFSHPYSKDLEHLDDKVHAKKLNKIEFKLEKSEFVRQKPPKDLVPLSDDKEGQQIWISKGLLNGPAEKDAKIFFNLAQGKKTPPEGLIADFDLERKALEMTWMNLNKFSCSKNRPFS